MTTTTAPQMIGRPNNLNVIDRKKTKRHKWDFQKWLYLGI
jgi:hypothetical protein